ncbi:MAG: MOSC domain-containing protein [Candidatus Pelagadaptatus aseana]|uniref:MOSC domain-containing protein n=1 Tax=Candidatus Pelagadaptatus aseana TaxID=3120508 RepID=UPI0039B21E19
MINLRQLWVYPVKSLRGIELDQSLIGSQGLAYDRQWMLVMPNGRFVTQRQLPQMALINTALDDHNLTLSCDGHGSVDIPLHHPAGCDITATVWRDTVAVQEASEEASRWLTRTLNAPQPLRLVRMAPAHQRQHINPERFGPDHHTLFADAAPFLIANLASLQELNRHLQAKGQAAVDIRRFRPNLVIDGLPAFAEHSMKQLTLGEFQFTMVDHCERCIITTIDPDTATKDPAMATYKHLAEINPMPDNPKAPAFGVNATLGSSAKTLIQTVNG